MTIHAHGPMRADALLAAFDEVEPAWDDAGTRRLTPHVLALRPDGERLVLAFLRQRAAGPRYRLGD